MGNMVEEIYFDKKEECGVIRGSNYEKECIGALTDRLKIGCKNFHIKYAKLDYFSVINKDIISKTLIGFSSDQQDYSNKDIGELGFIGRSGSRLLAITFRVMSVEYL